MNTLYNTRNGFTMIETIVFSGVFLIVLGAVVSVLNYTYRSGRFVNEQAVATIEVRKGVQALVQAIRESSYADNGAFPLVSMSANSITVYTDIDNDGSAERVTFTIENEVLVKKVLLSSGNPPVYTGTEITTPIASFIRNDALSVPLFSYYATDGTAVTDYTRVTDVASVLVRLVVNIYPLRAPEDYEIRSRATFRNSL